MKTYEYEQGNKALFLWLLQHRQKGEPLSEPLLQERAQILHKELSERELVLCI
jgi:hypothetical protein